MLFFAKLFMLTVFLASKKWKKVPHFATLCLTIAQVYNGENIGRFLPISNGCGLWSPIFFIDGYNCGFCLYSVWDVRVSSCGTCSVVMNHGRSTCSSWFLLLVYSVPVYGLLWPLLHSFSYAWRIWATCSKHGLSYWLSDGGQLF